MYKIDLYMKALNICKFETSSFLAQTIQGSVLLIKRIANEIEKYKALHSEIKSIESMFADIN